jgi:sporulation protein YlmC with PRC-barrel domain
MKMAGDMCSEATGGWEMLTPFGTKVVNADGKAVGSRKHLVLDPQSRQVVGLVVHQGILNRREVVVPLTKVAAYGEDVRLALHADEIDDLQLFHAPHFQVMPDHWEMPLGFDQRDFFLVASGLGWAGGELPLETTSPTVSGTPRVIVDPAPAEDQEELDVAAGMHVYDRTGQRVGDVEAIEFDQASGKIRRLTIRRGFLFHTDVTIPASMIGTISDRIALNIDAETVKSLEPSR